MMYRETIRHTPFTGKYADEMIPNINGTDWNNDVSFLATLRAMFGHRIKPDDGLDFTTKIWPISSNYTTNFAGAKDTIEAFNKARGLFMVVDCRTYVSTNENAVLDGIVQHVTTSIPTFKEVKAARKYYAPDIKCVAFVDDENRNFLIVVLDMFYRSEIYHRLQATVLSIFHWYEDKQPNGKYAITAAETDMINALSGKTSTIEDYEMALNRVSAEFFGEEGDNGRVQNENK